MPEQSLVIKNVRTFQFLLCLLSHPWWQTLPFHTAAPVRAFRSSTPAMALDSEATFKARCQEMHMTDGVYDALHAASIATFAQLAFCTPHSSSGIDDAALMSHLRGILEDRLTDAVKAVLRRLAFEAQALALQDLKNKLERTTDSAPKVLPLQEKLERIRDQQTRLSGITFTAHNSPSHALIDKITQQGEDLCIAYVAPDKCASRYQECIQDKSQASLKFRSDGSLRITQESPELTCDVSSAHLLRMAFQRRALAYDAAQLLSFHVQDKWNQALFDRMSCPTLPGFTAFSLDQLLAADRALWLKLSEQTRGTIKQLDASGAKLGDVAFAALANDPEVMFHCLPLPKGVPRPSPAHDRPRGKKRALDDSSKGRGKAKGGPSTQPPKSSGKGKSKQEQPSTRITPPPGAKVKFGDPSKPKYVCMKANLGKCRATVPFGARCSNGWHVCWWCHQDHAGHTCPNRAE